jgi:hypothetical protein
MQGTLPVNSAAFESFVTAGRHSNTWLFFSCQSPKGTSTTLRTQSDLVFLYYFDALPVIKLAHEFWFSRLGDLSKFNNLFWQVTQRYTALVYFKQDGNTTFRSFKASMAPPGFKMFDMEDDENYLLGDDEIIVE